MITVTENLVILNDKLKKLLDDPHPGLITWKSAVIHIIDQMSEIVG